jgi:hypothetical protein
MLQNVPKSNSSTQEKKISLFGKAKKDTMDSKPSSGTNSLSDYSGGKVVAHSNFDQEIF